MWACESVLASVQSALNTSRVSICWLARVNNSRIDSTQRRHLDEITKNKQGTEARIVNFRNERKKTNLKQHDRSILKHK